MPTRKIGCCAFLLAVVVLGGSMPGYGGSGFDHSPYDSLLKRNVVDGLVNYQHLKNSDSELLKEYLSGLERVDPRDFETWDRDSQMAFWINAYNAITIYAIVEHYPIGYGGLIARVRFPKNSIRQIKNVWDTVYVRVMGKALTLNIIEHDILRKQFHDPRVHFALVCASRGCPPLLNEAYSPGRLDEQLDIVTKRFITGGGNVLVDAENKTLTLSSLFDWYKSDFPAGDAGAWVQKYRENERGIVQFLVQYLDSGDARTVKNTAMTIKYLNYDWSLNETTMGFAW